jgi:co-chaperonin GroES (HSP10)
MKMLNSNVCCKNLDEVVQKVGNVIIPSKNKAYKRLEVVESGDESVSAGDIIYVRITSGYEVDVEKDKYTVVNASEIILIL